MTQTFAFAPIPWNTTDGGAGTYTISFASTAAISCTKGGNYSGPGWQWNTGGTATLF